MLDLHYRSLLCIVGLYGILLWPPLGCHPSISEKTPPLYLEGSCWKKPRNCRGKNWRVCWNVRTTRSKKRRVKGEKFKRLRINRCFTDVNEFSDGTRFAVWRLFFWMSPNALTHIPRTQMTSFWLEKALFWRAWPSKIEVSSVLPTSCQAKMKSLETKIAEMQVEPVYSKKNDHFNVDWRRCHVDLFFPHERMDGMNFSKIWAANNWGMFFCWWPAV